MIKRCTYSVVIGAGLLVAGAATGLAWDEEEMSLSQVPAQVREALLKLAGGAKITVVERENEHGAVSYEAEWEVNGREAEAEVTADGNLVKLEQEIGVSEVPAAVKATVAKKFPAGTKIEYERITMHFYEIEAEIGGREKEILVSPTGKILHAEAGEDDHDDDDHDDDDHDHGHDHDHHDD